MTARIRLFIQRSVTVCLWLYAIIRGGLDWYGRAAVFDDTSHALGVIERGVNWLFSTPWYVPTFLAAVATAALFWPNIKHLLDSDSPETPTNPPPARQGNIRLAFDNSDERCSAIHGPGIWIHGMALNLTETALENCEVELTDVRIRNDEGEWQSVGYLQSQNLQWCRPGNPPRINIYDQPELFDLCRALPGVDEHGNVVGPVLLLILPDFQPRWTASFGTYRFSLRARCGNGSTDRIAVFATWTGDLSEIPTWMERDQ
jgi:hypothetical protein